MDKEQAEFVDRCLKLEGKLNKALSSEVSNRVKASTLGLQIVKIARNADNPRVAMDQITTQMRKSIVEMEKKPHRCEAINGKYKAVCTKSEHSELFQTDTTCNGQVYRAYSRECSMCGAKE